MRPAFRFTQFIFLFGLILAWSCTPALTPIVETVTPSPAPAMKEPELVKFSTPDDAVLTGSLYGVGDMAVIFSVMGNCKRGWEEMAYLVAQHGMMALTYQWRACSESGTVVESELQKFVDDLRGAIRYMRGRGAKKIILAGASLGGVASAKLAVETSPDALIVLASPAEIPEWGLQIESEDVNIEIPKLFLTAENDSVVAASRTRELFELSAEPKEWLTYPGTAHGTDLFETESSQELQTRILNFILAIASAKQPI